MTLALSMHMNNFHSTENFKGMHECLLKFVFILLIWSVDFINFYVYLQEENKVCDHSVSTTTTKQDSTVFSYQNISQSMKWCSQFHINAT